MKGKVIWLMASSLVVLSLLLSACAPAAPAEKAPADGKPAAPAGGELVPAQKEAVAPEGGEGMVKWTGKKVDGTVVEKWLEKPKYGGVFTYSVARDAAVFDGANTNDYSYPPLIATNEGTTMIDWSRGQEGTGEITNMDSLWPTLELETGHLAESWEIPDDTTLIYRIRQGIRWHNKPPTNGRELTAEDVAFSIERAWRTPLNQLGGQLPYAATFESIATPDKYTVVIKTKPPLDNVGRALTQINGLIFIYSPDAVKKYGDLMDWRNNVGTGPFMLTDYMANTSWTLVRNPNYWAKDPLHPENQLPYQDGLKILVIPDLSTRISALRTGKIDILHGGASPLLLEDDAKAVIRTNPELKWQMVQQARTIQWYWRVDKKPFDDLRVRRALLIGMNRQIIRDSFYDGKGTMIMEPVPDIVEYQWLYTPLEQMPPSVQELYTYSPEKAKQLLAEAGYPNGFKTNIIVNETEVDLASVVRDQWAKIGVDLEIVVKEAGVRGTMSNRHQYDQLIGGITAAGNPYAFYRIVPGTTGPAGFLSPETEMGKRILGAREALARIYLFEKDPVVWKPAIKKVMDEITVYLLDQAHFIPFPGRMSYHFWQPWLKAYHGETFLGYYIPEKYIPYTWIDVELKKKMTGR